MRIPRVYTPNTLAPRTSITLEGQTAHYLIKVLRMDAGRTCILFNGEGAQFPSTITAVTKKSVTLHIEKQNTNASKSPLDIELIIGISKGDRMEWVLQKATELGVNRIRPIFTHRSEVKLKGERLDKKRQHWQQIIISACEQCTQNTLPQLMAPSDFETAVSCTQSEQKYVLHHRTDKTLAAMPPPKSVSLLVGPEGGLTEEEIIHAQNQNFNALALGPRVLRTETAPLAAISIMQHLWGDM